MVVAIALGIVLAVVILAVGKSAAKAPGEMVGVALQDKKERAALSEAIANEADPEGAAKAARELAARDSFNRTALIVVVLGFLGACVWAVVSNL